MRWCDGQLEFVGRMDAGQVKISGQRLELGEIEATILRTGLVTDAGVSYHKPTDTGDPDLFAYVVLDREQAPEVEDHACIQDAPATASKDASAVVDTVGSAFREWWHLSAYSEKLTPSRSSVSRNVEFDLRDGCLPEWYRG